jgi:hypothetical protein
VVTSGNLKEQSVKKTRNRLKKDTSKNSPPVQFKCTDKEYAFLLERAKVCTQGNVAAYVRAKALGLLSADQLIEDNAGWEKFRSEVF